MRFGRNANIAALALSRLLFSDCACAQLLGPQFQVNTYTTGTQVWSSVAGDGAGGFVMVWASDGSAGSDTSAASIQGQRYDSNGMAVGPEFQVNTYTTGYQSFPSVAADGAGNFVVVWQDRGGGSDPSYSGVQAQRYDASGTPVGAEFQVNSYTTGYQRFAAVAVARDGDFVVVWVSDGSAGSDTDDRSIQGQRYDASGVPLGGEFQVNTYTTSFQVAPAIAFDEAGRFVVVWESEGSLSDTSFRSTVQGQRFDVDGTPLGSQFQVNGHTTDAQGAPGVTADGLGNFVVIWAGGDVVNAARILGQRYDASGMPLGSQFQVNTFTYDFQHSPTVAADAVGNFVVVWESDEPLAPDPSGGGIFGRQFNANGAPLGAEFLVNSYTTGGQHIPAVAATGAGSFVAAWFSAYGDGSDPFLSNQAQRLTAPLATTDLLPGRLAVIKPGGLARIVAKPVSGDTFALPAADPMTTGGNIRLFDTASAAGDVSHALPTTGWRATRPPGPNGYYYRGAGTESDPCRLVLVTRNGIRAVCRLALTPPFAGDVGVILTVGTDRYCARFGGDDLRNNATITRRRRAPAPGACP